MPDQSGRFVTTHVAGATILSSVGRRILPVDPAERSMLPARAHEAAKLATDPLRSGRQLVIERSLLATDEPEMVAATTQNGALKQRHR